MGRGDEEEKLKQKQTNSHVHKSPVMSLVIQASYRHH